MKKILISILLTATLSGCISFNKIMPQEQPIATGDKDTFVCFSKDQYYRLVMGEKIPFSSINTVEIIVVPKVLLLSQNGYYVLREHGDNNNEIQKE